MSLQEAIALQNPLLVPLDRGAKRVVFSLSSGRS